MYWIDESDAGRLYTTSNQISFWADTKDDIANLPTSTAYGVQQGNDTVSCRPCGKGSTCMVIGTGKGAVMYGLNSNDEWILM